MNKLRDYMGAGVALVMLLMVSVSASFAQEYSALARYIDRNSRIYEAQGALVAEIDISQAVPYRVFTLDDPRRIVVDFNEVDWATLNIGNFQRTDKVLSLRAGTFRPGWSRMVLEIDAPYILKEATSRVSDNGRATVRLEFSMVDAETFAAASGLPEGGAQDATAVKKNGAPLLERRKAGETLRIVLDPGHGGIDPGASAEDAVEADLMLIFAQELKDILQRSGLFEVVLTRDRDQFVSLEERIAKAHQARAHVFVSLHADALAGGRASGVTIYTLSENASDIASEKLAERHDRENILAGVDLTYHDDEVADVLMDLARVETDHRTGELVEALIASLSETVEMYKKPHQKAGFSVLKSPDVPSVLIELGFISSPRDKERLIDRAWRIKTARAIRDGLILWMDRDAAAASLLRK